jgi:hypothetical protein
MKFRPRAHLFAAPLIALIALAGCDDSTGVDDTIQIVRITVGTQTAYFDTNGLKTCCDGAGNATLPSRIVIPATGTTATQTTVATFHRSDGSPIILDPAIYELRVEPGDTRITWTALPFPSGANLPFSGNLRRTSVGISPVRLSVVQKASGQTVFGPHTLQICTTAATANTTDCAT